MKKLFIFALFGLVAVAATILPDTAMALQAGETLLTDLVAMMRGSLGTMVGLGIALMGLYMWLVQQASWGIIMIIGGVAITAFPGIFSEVSTGFGNAFSEVSVTPDTVLTDGNGGGRR